MILSDKEKVIDENLYWLSNKPRSYVKLNDLAKVTLKAEIDKTSDNVIVINISNPTEETAFFIHLKICNQDNELILPVFLTENYFTLLRGENKQIGLEIDSGILTTENPELKLVIEGWNIIPQEKKF